MTPSGNYAHSEAGSEAAILNSWKEIASYLDRGIRTVQRWERILGLPVHRIDKGKRGPVFAIKSEIQSWLRAGAARNQGQDAGNGAYLPARY